ncbi:MAG: aspartyl protease family protein [Acidobacteria bacterium]|nr:aspartyl protease family protein [Acidobacteriota bacterium]
MSGNFVAPPLRQRARYWRCKSDWVVLLATILAATLAFAQQSTSNEEIPIGRCDVLPVVQVKVAGQDMRFLLDTGATTILNLKAFSAGTSRKISVESWQGSAATSAREVSLPDFQLGSHVLHELKLPAIDLSPIGKACGGTIDGILGVDLLDRMGVTIDLQRKVAVLNLEPADSKARFAEMEMAMGHCNVAFNEAKVSELEECFDPEIVLYTPHGEFRGRKEVMQYLNEQYFRNAKAGLHFEMATHDVRSFGDALWYSYDYKLANASEHHAGHGVAMCHRQAGKWLILNMHNALVVPAISATP